LGSASLKENEMKRIGTILATATAAMLVVYALAAFVAWSWNPGGWSADGRMFCAIFMVGAGVMAAGATAEIA
jgi:hypothetical protein